MRRIAVLDAPSNLGLRPPTVTSVPGCAKAPGALRDHGLLTKLNARDAGCLTPPRYDPGDWRPGDGVAHAPQIAAYSRALADRIGAILDAGEFPVVLGGDCSILLGSGVAMNRLGDAVGGRIGLVFVDGHSDFRHPGNASYVGAAAGEDLALVTGRGQPDLAAIEGRRPYFRDVDVVVMGIRAQDEYRLDLQAAGIVTRPVPALRAEGAARSAQWARDQLVDCAGYWVHCDVDVLDPAVMPAVDAPSQGGIAFPELEILLAGLVESPHCLGVEITVFDPDYDTDGSYAAEIVTAVTAGLAAAHTVSPRPDLIAARADLARRDRTPFNPPNQDAPGTPPEPPQDQTEPAYEPTSTPDHHEDVDRDGSELDAEGDRGEFGADGGHSEFEDHGESGADDSRRELEDHAGRDLSAVDDTRAEPEADVDDGAHDHGQPTTDPTPSDPVADLGTPEPERRLGRPDRVGGLNRLGLAAGFDRADLTAGLGRPERPGGLNRAGLNRTAGLNRPEPPGGLNRAEPAGGLNRAEPAGGLNRSELLSGLNRPEPAGGLNRSNLSDDAAFADEQEREHRRAAAASESVSLAAAGMSEGPDGTPDDVALPATTLLGVEDADELPLTEDETNSSAEAEPTNESDGTSAGTDPEVEPDEDPAEATLHIVGDGTSSHPPTDSPEAGGPTDVGDEAVDPGESARPIDSDSPNDTAITTATADAEPTDSWTDRPHEPAAAENLTVDPETEAPEPAETDEERRARLIPRPLGQSPLLDSDPLPATRPGLLRPRSTDERESFSLPVQRPAFDLGTGEPADIA